MVTEVTVEVLVDFATVNFALKKSLHPEMSKKRVSKRDLEKKLFTLDKSVSPSHGGQS